MVFSREYPHSFGDALRICREILAANRDLVRKGLLDTESEQLVIGAHRLATGEILSRARFFSILQDRLPETTAEKVLILAGRRAEGVPLQHVLGYQSFLDHEYEVDASTLVPRPETEVLVRQAVSELEDPKLGLEVGLGSGVISIELLHAFSGLRMAATEISAEAAALARKNARKILGDESASRLEILTPESPEEVLEPFSRREADFLIANPPYLDARSPGETDAEVLKHEPRGALFPQSGDPLYFYERIAASAAGLLRDGGKLFLEIASERSEPTLALFVRDWNARLVPDLAGRPRVLIAEKLRGDIPRGNHG